MDWYTTYYGEQYADSVRHALTAERSAAEVDFILRETRLEPPASIADVACGEGRHALAFATHGFDVTGVDQNESFLENARQRTLSGVSARFIVGDMRAPVGGGYQLVTLLFHSFGFFSDAENRDLLVAWAARLAPGGWFVLDVWNRDAILRHFMPDREWQTPDGLTIRERQTFDLLMGRLTMRYTYRYPEGQTHEYDASFRLYTSTELRDLCLAAGLHVMATYGSLSGEPYTLDARRLVLFAQR